MPTVTSSTDTYVFLSPEWVHEVTRSVQSARRNNEDFKRVASQFSLSLSYLISDIPEELQQYYPERDRIAIFVQLEEGTVRRLHIGPQPCEQADFTVASDYGLAKQIFQGDSNAVTCFMNGELSVEPLRRVYERPAFAAKSIVAGNLLLKIARQVPTSFAFSA